MSSGVVCLSLPESFLLVRQLAWGGLERKEDDQEAKFVILISIPLVNLISLVFSILYGSTIRGQLLVTRRDVSKLCMLKGAVNDSCTQNWDDLDHYQLFLQRTLTHTSPSFPSITTYTSGKSKGILD